MLRQIKSQFKSQGQLTLEIIKEAQIYSWFLTNRSTHPLASYPLINDPACILPAGMKLQVIKILPRNGIIVSNPSGHQFTIFGSDIKRFTKFACI